jgi:hypothetical protein
MLFALILALPLAARADIVYDWVNLTPNAAGFTFQGSIAINPAYASVGGSVQSPSTPLINDQFEPYFGVDFLSASFGGTFSCTLGPCFGITETGPTPVMCDSCEAIPTPVYQTFGDQSDGTPMDLNLGAQFMTGSLEFLGYYEGFGMESVGNIWTVEFAGNDGYGPCDYSGNSCGGETGEWVLDAPADPPGDPPMLPEPPMLALFGLGMLAWGVRRRGAA